MGWRMCIDYRKLNAVTKKDHFPLPFIDEMLERLAKNSFFCFLDGYSGYHQIPIHPDDQSKTTFTCPYGTYAYRRMSFGLCNCWWSLMLIINHQLLHEKEWNEPQSIVVGFDSNEFHELCCSHLFYRIFIISLYKSISSDELEHIITKSSSRRSKRTYHLLYLEFRRESPRWIRLERF
jgi:hypothetical protein